MSFIKSIPSSMLALGHIMDRATNVTSEVHGIRHWRQVAEAGLEIAQHDRSIDLSVLYLFAMAHDSMRENDFQDPEHGARAAHLVRELDRWPERPFDLSEEQLNLLCYTIDNHTHVQSTDNPTVGACWDADRLTLPRVGIKTDPDYLHHEYSKRGDVRQAWQDTMWDGARVEVKSFYLLAIKYHKLDEERGGRRVVRR